MSSFLKDFELLETLGSGSYGKVTKLRRKIDGEFFVVKTIQLSGATRDEQEEILNEARLHASLNHPCIIGYRDSFVFEGNLNIVMDFAPGGDLHQLLKKMGPFPQEVVLLYLAQIAQGLKYMHDRRTLHRDLKPQNIFIGKKGNVLIGDVGLGRVMSAHTMFARTTVGTPLYFSPELVEELPYSFKSDIWALGVVTYELIAGHPPFVAKNQIALAKKIVADDPPPLADGVSTDLKFLISRMLEKNPEDRPEINQILEYSHVRVTIERERWKEEKRMILEEARVREEKLIRSHETEMQKLLSELKKAKEEAIVAQELQSELKKAKAETQAAREMCDRLHTALSIQTQRTDAADTALANEKKARPSRPFEEIPTSPAPPFSKYFPVENLSPKIYPDGPVRSAPATPVQHRRESTGSILSGNTTVSAPLPTSTPATPVRRRENLGENTPQKIFAAAAVPISPDVILYAVRKARESPRPKLGPPGRVMSPAPRFHDHHVNIRSGNLTDHADLATPRKTESHQLDSDFCAQKIPFDFLETKKRGKCI